MKERLGSDVIRCVGYGHVGDGNMHLNMTTKTYDKKVMANIEPFLYEWTGKVNGSISAEHGEINFDRNKQSCNFNQFNLQLLYFLQLMSCFLIPF